MGQVASIYLILIPISKYITIYILFVFILVSRKDFESEQSVFNLVTRSYMTPIKLIFLIFPLFSYKVRIILMGLLVKIKENNVHR